MRNKHVLVAIVVSFISLGMIVGFISVEYLKEFLDKNQYNEQDFIDSSTYQAVFLTNEQIYFGQLKDINSDFVILYNVYYLKADDSGNQLVKLGFIEPHGPKDMMTISKEQILFWENLKLNSPIIKTIQSMSSLK